MVYCGKASQGCQSCRTRRIRCDKKRPECSQCIRVGKKCPGYRDQLSLIFRDESSKVIQKAHAQWGNPGSPADGAESSSQAGSSLESSAISVLSRRLPYMSANEAQAIMASKSKIPRRVEPNIDQRGLKFYVERYLLNHPDSPRTPELMDLYFGDGDAMRSVMIAVGLAGMSNLLGNKSMSLVARSKYVTALKQTGQLLVTASQDRKSFMKPLRSIVTLALFEVVQSKGSKLTAGTANTHIHGAIALSQSVLPVKHSPNGGARGILQLLFSMLIPCQMTDMPLPPGFFECLKTCQQLLQDCIESCGVDLAFAIARLLELLLIVDRATPIDGQPEIDDLIQQFLSEEAALDHMEDRLRTAYPFVEHQVDEPSPALFRGRWHRYSEIWGARIWNHYRWARLLLGEYIIRFTIRYPRSSARHIRPPHRVQCYATIERVAEEMLTSTPSHWHHPVLDEATAKKYEAPGQGGAGAAGLPTLLWHLKVSGCAPNVPPDFWDWAYNILQVVWRSMGMYHALSLAEVMEEHRRSLQTDTTSRSPVIVSQEPVEALSGVMQRL
ncbi:hypothetical protein F5B22DRAFT_297379 [Xylaria bambusicola]|uniref:uncharacterized protein n=1 Tax=Xylaria bambusicola TaxID=326684 RepID=UPI0020088EE1|nr:uncharacterized protein F5B22DRAFT_297379 [Xylaria bambusicola]KAI0512578.1 hypothetical protein F5B22DRAFT_297379 [Xylaria bambusicola]